MLKKCNYCDRTDGLEEHHILAKSLGGPDDASNLVTLCGFHHGVMHDVPDRQSISALTKSALARAKAKGVKLGNRTNLTEVAKLGSAATKLAADKFAVKMLEIILPLLSDGYTYQGVVDKFNGEGVPTARGGKWGKTTVANIVSRHKSTKDLRADSHTELPVHVPRRIAKGQIPLFG